MMLVAGLIVLLLLVLGAGLGYMRSESGERRIAALLIETLQQAGISAEIDSLRGPLPERLFLRGLRLSDADGVWLEIPEATLALQLGTLLHGQLTISELTITDPVLWRIPVLPASPPIQESASPSVSEELESLSSLLTTIFERSTLDNLRIETFRLGAAVLNRPTTENPPVKLTLTGGGSLTDWIGNLTATLLPAVSAPVSELVPGTLTLGGTLQLGNRGDWLAGAHSPDAAVRLKLDAALLTDATPRRFASIQTLLTLRGAQVALAELIVNVPGGTIQAQDIALAVKSEEAASLLTGTLSAVVDDPALLNATLTSTLATLDSASASQQTSDTKLPFANAHMKATVSGNLSKAYLALELGVAEVANEKDRSLDATLHVTLADALNQPVMHTEGEIKLAGMPSVVLAAEAAKEQSTVRLRLLKLHSELVELSASGAFNPETGALDATARIEIPALRRLAEVPQFAPFVAQLDSVAEEGRVELLFTTKRAPTYTPLQHEVVQSHSSIQNAEIQPDSSLQKTAIQSSAPFIGTLQLRLNAMHWGLPQMQGLLGEEVDVHAGFRVLPEAHPGNPLPDLTVQDFSLRAGQLAAKGSVRLIPDTASATVDGDLVFNAQSLSALEAGLTGAVETRLRVRGPLTAPRVDGTLTSPSLGVGKATLDNLKIEVQTPAFTLATLDARGTLHIATSILTAPGSSAVTRDNGTKATLATAWAFRPEAFSVRDILFTAPGLRLKGALEGRLPAGQRPRFDGNLDAVLDNWTTLSALGNVPIQGGKAHLKLDLNARNGGQVLTADWAGTDFSSTAVSLKQLSGRLNVRDLFGTPDILLRTTFGAGTAGAFGWTGGTVNLTGPLRALQASATLQGRTQANLGLTLNLPGQTALLSRLELRTETPRTGSGKRSAGKDVGLRLEQPATLSFKPASMGVDNLHVALLPQGKLRAKARFGSSLMLDANLSDLAIGTLRPFLNVPIPDGQVAAQIALSGTLTRPQGTLSLSLADVVYPGSDMAPAKVQVRGQLQNPTSPQLVLDASVTGLGATPLTANLTIPVAPGLTTLAMTRPLTGAVRWKGSLAPLWQFVPLANSRLTGQGQLEATVSGTPATPLLSADLQLAKAAFEDILVGLFLADINATVHLDSAGLSRLSFSAGDGQGGSVRLDGSIGSLAEGLPLLLNGELTNLAPLHRTDLNLTLSGTTRITGPVTAPDVQAAITVNKGVYQIVPSFGTSIPTLDVVEVEHFTPTELFGSLPDTVNGSASAHPGGPRLNVTVNIPNRFFVRGSGLESEWEGDLQVTGTASSPVLTGGLSSIRGQFGLLGKQFVLTKGAVLFSGGTPPDPLLDIVVTYNAASITAQATLSGTATAPVLTLSSQPPLPQDEVVAQVLFGQSVASLGRMEAIQLASQVAMLAAFGNGTPGLLEKTRDAFGIDVLRFGSIQREQSQQIGRPGLLQPGQSGSSDSEEGDSGSIPALEVGKYVSDDVYVGLQQGMNGDAGGVRIEVELTPNLNLEGSTTPQGSEVGINWKRDY